MSDEVNRLSMLLHGFSGVGKTPVSNTTLGPRLMIDVENTSKWLKNHKVMWDGKSNPMDLPGLTPDTTVVVKIHEYYTVNDVTTWLISGKHPFRAVSLDSLSELQLKMLKTWAGNDKREFEHWGKLLIWCENLILDLKNLTENPIKPVDCVTIICGSDTRDDRIVPLLDGAIKKKIQFKLDLIAYMKREEGPGGEDYATFTIQPTENIEAKDRTQILAPHFGRVIERPNMMEIMRVLNTTEVVA